jgi:hypothetical protein
MFSCHRLPLRAFVYCWHVALDDQGGIGLLIDMMVLAAALSLNWL